MGKVRAWFERTPAAGFVDIKIDRKIPAAANAIELVKKGPDSFQNNATMAMHHLPRIPQGAPRVISKALHCIMLQSAAKSGAWGVWGEKKEKKICPCSVG